MYTVRAHIYLCIHGGCYFKVFIIKLYILIQDNQRLCVLAQEPDQFFRGGTAYGGPEGFFRDGISFGGRCPSPGQGLYRNHTDEYQTSSQKGGQV